MKHGRDIVIVVPTRHRIEFWLRLERFYRHGEVAVVPAVEGVNDAEAVRLALKSIDAPYCVWSGDDDFYDPDMLWTMADMLADKPGWIGVNGSAVVMDYATGNIGPYPLRALNGDTAFDRMMDVCTRYFPAQFGLFRTETLRWAFNVVGDPFAPWAARTCAMAATREVLLTLMLAHAGGILHEALSEFLVRGAHKGRNAEKVAPDWKVLHAPLRKLGIASPEALEDTYRRRVPWGRRGRLWWFIKKPRSAFITKVRRAIGK